MPLFWIGGNNAASTTPNGQPAILVAANDAPQRIKDIADFTCDGTADEVQIQAALDELTTASTTGGEVQLSEGTFTCAAGITFDAPLTTLKGSGNGTRLSFDGATVSPLLEMADDTVRQFIRIIDMTIISTTDGSGTAVEMDDFSFGLVQNVEMIGVNRGVNFAGVTNDTHYNMVRDCRIDLGNGTTPIGVNINDSNFNNLDNVRIKGGIATGKGIVISGSHTCGLSNVDVETGFDIGIDIDTSAHGCSLFNCYSEANLTNLNIASGVIGTSIFGGFYIDATDGNGFNIVDGGTDTQIVGARWDNNLGTLETSTRIKVNELAMDPLTSLAVTSNAVTAQGSYILINSSVAETVNTVNGLRTGTLVVIQSSSSAAALTLTEGGSPAFVLAGSADFVLTSTNFRWLGIKAGNGNLVELARMTP